MVPSANAISFPSSAHFQVTINFRYLSYNQQYVRRIVFQNADSRFELVPSDSSPMEMMSSERKSVVFLLKNSNSFPSNFTFNGHFESDNGFIMQNNKSLPFSFLIYPQESVQIDIIESEMTDTGSTNTFTLHAYNGCIDLYANRTITIVDKVSQFTSLKA